MAVYTKITKDELEDFLSNYELGALSHFEGIEQGVSNTNYHIFTSQDRYVLTIFETRRVNENDLPFFLSFSTFLAENGIKCPLAIQNKDGKVINKIKGCPATIINFLNGRDIAPKDLTTEHCGQMGAFLAKMHNISKDFEMSRENSMGFSNFQVLYQKIANRSDEFEHGLDQFLHDELKYLQSNWPRELPIGVIHADVFPDNVFF